MREIKFRAWDKTEERMYTVDGVFRDHVEVNESVNDDGDIDLYGDYVLMQFTGLHDKNGKEIYEGDIVTTGVFAMLRGQRTEEKRVEIGFAPGRFILKDGGVWLISPHETQQMWTVIGNIYENPELLELRPSHNKVE